MKEVKYLDMFHDYILTHLSKLIKSLQLNTDEKHKL